MDVRVRGAKLGQRLAKAVTWTQPTSTEIGVVVKSGLAAGLAWFLSGLVVGIENPVLASLSAIVVVQVSVRASVRSAIERSLAVVLGVLVALTISDALRLNALTVTVLVALSLAVGELLLRLPTAAARQIPISVLVVLAAVTANNERQGWERAIDTLLGAAVGVAVSLVLPASRLVDARQTIERLSNAVGEVLESMGAGLHEAWTSEQTGSWRDRARVARGRLAEQAAEAVGNSKEAARWNVRDRRHVDELVRLEEVMPRLERTAIGVSVIARGLDDHSRMSGATHAAMPSMGALLVALAEAVRATAAGVLGNPTAHDLDAALAEVRVRRQRCVQAASRRARTASESDADDAQVELEWLNYTAVLVQVDRIAADLSAPLPA